MRDGAICQSTSDTEAILHLVARSRHVRIVDRVMDALRQIEGAYALVMMTNKKLIGARDPLGIRPLVLGELDGRYILASETCALDIIGARFVRDVENGEMVVISEEGIESIRFARAQPLRPCIFEYIYFARPDSVVNGKNVYSVRKNIGVELAKESPAEADIIIPVPDSGVPAALGYAQQTGLPYELGIIRNHYVGRTFIQPTQRCASWRQMKHSANRAAVVEGKRIVLVDDSLVRGTTSVKIVRMMREAGPARCISASPRRRSPIPTSTASTRRRRRSCSPPPTTSRACASISAPTRSPSCRSRGCTGRWARRAATPPARNTPTTASPATTRRR